MTAVGSIPPPSQLPSQHLPDTGLDEQATERAVIRQVTTLTTVIALIALGITGKITGASGIIGLAIGSTSASASTIERDFGTSKVKIAGIAAAIGALWIGPLVSAPLALFGLVVRDQAERRICQEGSPGSTLFHSSLGVVGGVGAISAAATRLTPTLIIISALTGAQAAVAGFYSIYLLYLTNKRSPHLEQLKVTIEAGAVLERVARGAVEAGLIAVGAAGVRGAVRAAGAGGAAVAAVTAGAIAVGAGARKAEGPRLIALGAAGAAGAAAVEKVVAELNILTL